MYDKSDKHKSAFRNVNKKVVKVILFSLLPAPAEYGAQSIRRRILFRILIRAVMHIFAFQAPLAEKRGG